MNLVTKPWIPVLFADGRHERVSLHDAFAQGDTIADLAVNPIQRIALMRLLVCIAQAALDGPANEEDWLACRKDLAQRCMEYLDNPERIDRFELYGDKPFLQVNNLKPGKTKEAEVEDESDDATNVGKLDICLAAGHNATLFDHIGSSENARIRSDASTALALLLCQSFSLGGGKSATAKWDTVLVDGSANERLNNNFTAAPCAGSKAFVLLLGASLLDSVHLNLVPKSTLSTTNLGFGRPIWGCFPASYGGENVAKLKKGYLQRLVPLSRFVLISAKNKARLDFYVNGYEYPNDPKLARDPMCVTVRSEQDDGQVQWLRLENNRHPWRDLHGVLAVRAGTQTGALCLRNLLALASVKDKTPVHIWVGGLLSSQAAPEEPQGWSFALGTELLGDAALTRYEAGVRLAEKTESAINRAVSQYWLALARSEFKLEDEAKWKYKRNGKREREFRGKIFASAVHHFWSRLDATYHILMDVCTRPEVGADAPWRNEVVTAMRDAYEQACPHDSPRQLQAYAIGLRHLHLKQPSDIIKRHSDAKPDAAANQQETLT